jgi:hypothetical protein
MKPADFPARDPGQIKETLKDLRILGEYASSFERLFLGKELTLEAHLDNLSTRHTCSSPSSVKTIFLHLHANNMASQFVPAQQYSNTQRMIRAIFWSVATSQIISRSWTLHIHLSKILESSVTCMDRATRQERQL